MKGDDLRLLSIVKKFMQAHKSIIWEQAGKKSNEAKFAWSRVENLFKELLKL